MVDIAIDTTTRDIVAQPAGPLTGAQVRELGQMLGRGCTARAATFTAGLGDRGRTFLCTGTYSVAFAAAATLGNGWHCVIVNDGVGTITLDPNASEVIANGASASSTTYALAPNQAVVVACDGTKLRVIADVGGVFALSTVPVGALLYGAGAAPLTTLAIGSNGQALTIVSSLPAWADHWTTAKGIGAAPTGGNGLLQLASGTTKANGIALGTDVFLYRIGGASMAFEGGTWLFSSNASNTVQIGGSNTNNLSLRITNNASGGRDYILGSGGASGPLGAGGFFLYDNTASVLRIALDASGNVGIGNVVPTAGNGLLQLTSGTTKANGIALGTDVFMYRLGGASMAFEGGNWLFSSNTSNTVQIVGSNTNNLSLRITNNASGGRDYILGSGGAAGPMGAGGFFIYDGTASALRIALDASGNVGIGNVVPTAGNGLLQLTSGTTKANGIAFGTDTFFYRAAAGVLRHNSAEMVGTDVGFTNGAGAGAGTLLNAPAAGNPTKWIPINDNGTTRYIPAW